MEFLPRHGADLTHKNSHRGSDSFVVAAKGAGIPWEPSVALDGFLTWLNGPTATASADNALPPIPSEVRKNPLVKKMLELKGIKSGVGKNWLNGRTFRPMLAYGRRQNVYDVLRNGEMCPKCSNYRE